MLLNGIIHVKQSKIIILRIGYVVSSFQVFVRSVKQEFIRWYHFIMILRRTVRYQIYPRIVSHCVCCLCLNVYCRLVVHIKLQVYCIVYMINKQINK